MLSYVYTFANDASFSLTYFFIHHLVALSGYVSNLPSLFYSFVSQNLLKLASTGLEYKDFPLLLTKKVENTRYNHIRELG